MQVVRAMKVFPALAFAAAAVSNVWALLNVAESGIVTLQGDAPSYVNFDYINYDVEDANIPVVIAFIAGQDRPHAIHYGDISVHIANVTADGFTISHAFSSIASNKMIGQTNSTEVYWLAVVAGLWKLNNHITIQANSMPFREQFFKKRRLVDLEIDTSMMQSGTLSLFGKLQGSAIATPKNGPQVEKKFNTIHFQKKYFRAQYAARVELEENDKGRDNKYTVTGMLGYIAVNVQSNGGDDFSWLKRFNDLDMITRMSLIGQTAQKGLVSETSFKYAKAFDHPPHIFAEIESYKRNDPSHVVSGKSTEEGTEVYLVEDTTLDNETYHSQESVALLSIAKANGDARGRHIRIPAMSCAFSVCEAGLCTETSGGDNKGFECVTEPSPTSGPATPTAVPHPPPPHNPNKKGKGKSNTGAIVGIIIGALLIAGLGVGGVYFYRRRKKRTIIENYMSLNAEGEELLFSDDDDGLLE